MKSKILAWLEVKKTEVKNIYGCVLDIARQRVGQVEQLPTGSVVIKLYGFVDFDRLPTDAQVQITAILTPVDDENAYQGNI